MPSSIRLTIPLEEAHRSGKSGRKAANLSKLIAAGFDVPRGFVIVTDAYRYHLWAAGSPKIADTDMQAEDREALRSAIIGREIAEDIWNVIALAYQELARRCGLDEPKVAVRSSAVHDFAGAYESCINVKGLTDLKIAVKQVWASIWNGRAAAFRARLRPHGEPAMAVIVQEMAGRSVSGCALTASPVTGNPNRILVTCESTRGREEHFEFDLAEPFSVCSADSPEKRVATLVAERAILIEDVFQSRVEVEWSHDGSRLWILQARPLVDVPCYFPFEPATEADANVEWRKATTRPVSPLSRSLLWETLRRRPEPVRGTRAVRRELINGYAYRHIANDDRVDKQGNPARSRAREMARGFELLHRWRAELRPSLRSLCAGIISSDRSSMNHRTLVRSLMTAWDTWRRTVELLDESRYAAARFGRLLRDFLGSGTDARSLYQRLMFGAAEAVVTRDARLQDLADQLAAARKLGRLDEAGWWNAFRGEVEAFAREYGYAFADFGEAYDIASWRSWIEDPEPLFRLIAALSRRGKRTSLVTLHQASRASTRSAELEAAELYEGRAADYFCDVLELARGWLEAGTEAESLCALAAAALRLVMIELAGRLVESGVLRAEQDIFVLQVEEMIRLLASTGKAQKASAAGLLARRKHELWLQGRLAAPGRLRPEGYGPETPSTIGARGIVRGRGVSPGAATGRVCPARTPAEASNMANGDILIVKSPSLAWTPFFGVAGAFACEDDDESWIGSIAADYGIPAVIGCEGITSAFVQGERVTVDGRNGFVELSRGRFSRAEEEILADEDPIAALLRKNR